MEIFVRDAENKTGKWRSVPVNVSICLLTSRPIPECHFHLRAVGCGFGMYEDTKWHNVISRLKQLLGLIYRYYILIPCVESSDETNRLT